MTSPWVDNESINAFKMYTRVTSTLTSVAQQAGAPPAQATRNNPGATSDTAATTTGVWLDLTGASAVTFVKQFTTSSLRVDFYISGFTTGANNVVKFGVRYNSQDFEICKMSPSAVSVRQYPAGTRLLSDAVAGSLTLTPRVSGQNNVVSANFRQDTGDYFSMCVTEVT